jgi:hypothetical protein
MTALASGEYGTGFVLQAAERLILLISLLITPLSLNLYFHLSSFIRFCFSLLLSFPSHVLSKYIKKSRYSSGNIATGALTGRPRDRCSISAEADFYVKCPLVSVIVVRS